MTINTPDSKVHHAIATLFENIGLEYIYYTRVDLHHATDKSILDPGTEIFVSHFDESVNE